MSSPAPDGGRDQSASSGIRKRVKTKLDKSRRLTTVAVLWPHFGKMFSVTSTFEPMNLYQFLAQLQEIT